MPPSPVIKFTKRSERSVPVLGRDSHGQPRPYSKKATAESPTKSVQMRDAQKLFRRVVKSELDILLRSGMERERAVRCLLERIVDLAQEPSDEEVRSVMKQFRMNKEDAIRALIVKQVGFFIVKILGIIDNISPRNSAA